MLNAGAGAGPGTARRHVVWLATAALAALIASCGDPPVPAPPYTSEVLSHVGGGRYEVRAEPLATVRHFPTLTGDAARFRGGGFVRADRGTGGTEQALRAALRVRDDEPLRLDYRIEGGVVRAYDYDTFALLSLYRAIERTRAFYQSIGVTAGELPPLPVWFRPRIEVLFIPVLASNNAAYSPPIGGLLFFNDFLEGGGVPLALNLGVVAHEYGHALFQHLVWGDRLAPWATARWPDEPVNHLRALDEGLADLFGAAITGDPRFIGRSVEAIADERDLAAARPPLGAARLSGDIPQVLYDPYPLGSDVAGALWQAGAAIGVEAVARYVAEAERRLAGQVTQAFRIGAFLDLLAAVASEPAHRQALCAAFTERLAEAGPFPCCAGRCP